MSNGPWKPYHIEWESKPTTVPLPWQKASAAKPVLLE